MFLVQCSVLSSRGHSGIFDWSPVEEGRADGGGPRRRGRGERRDEGKERKGIM